MSDTNQEMNFIQGEGLELKDEDVITEFDNVIEYEISESVSFLYSKNEKKYYLNGIDYENSFDEFSFELDNDFDGMYFDGLFVSKEDFIDFKKLVEQNVV